MSAILRHIGCLERYAERGGARVVRTVLPEGVWGRALCDLIVLQSGLSPEQELPTLVHELTHWLAHRHARPGPECTLFEYEAEAVEALVMARLGLRACPDSPTDSLLSASIIRVVWASRRICAALGVDTERPGY